MPEYADFSLHGAGRDCWLAIAGQGLGFCGSPRAPTATAELPAGGVSSEWSGGTFSSNGAFGLTLPRRLSKMPGSGTGPSLQPSPVPIPTRFMPLG